MLDASIVIRFFKIGRLSALDAGVRLHVSGQVEAEIKKGGPTQRAALGRLGPRVHDIVVGSAEWQVLARLRADRSSTADLGEDESIAVCECLGKSEGEFALATCDRGAARRAAARGLHVVGFVEVLAWLVRCGALTIAEAREAELEAGPVDGWKRPPGFPSELSEDWLESRID